MDTSENLNGEKDNLGGAGRKQMWKILKKKYPKTSPDVPVGKKDKSGNLNNQPQRFKTVISGDVYAQIA